MAMQELLVLKVKDFINPKLKTIKKSLGQVAKKADAVTGKVGDKFETLGKKVKGISFDFKKMGNAAASEIPMIGELARLAKNPYVALAVAVIALGVAFFKAGQHMSQVSKEMKEQQIQARQVMGLTKQQSENVAVSMRATSRILGGEYKENLIAANALSKAWANENVDGAALVRKAYLAGADAQGDMLSQIKEYSVQAKDFGLKSSETIALIQQTAMMGIPTDKGIDAFKEFKLKMFEQTKATKDSIEAVLGKKAGKKLFAGVNDGSITALTAMKQVSAAMNNPNLSKSKLQGLIANAFGGPGEDAGEDFLKNIHKINFNLDELVAKNKDINSSMLGRLKVEEQIGKKITKVAPTYNRINNAIAMFGLKIKSAFYSAMVYINPFIQGIVDAISWVKNLGTRSKILGDTFKFMSWITAKTFEIIKIALGAVWGQVKQVKNAFVFLGQVFAPLGRKIEAWYGKVRPYLIRLKNIVDGLFKTMYNLVTFNWSEIGNSVKQVANGGTGKGSKTLASIRKMQEQFKKNGTKPKEGFAVSDIPEDAGKTEGLAGAAPKGDAFTGIQGEKNTVRNVTVNIAKLIGVENIISEGGNVDLDELASKVEEMLIRSIRNAEAII